MKIHLLAVAVVVCAGIWRGLAPWGWAAVCICFGLVLGAELCNTAVERLCDIVQPERDERVGRVKDIAAGAVLVCAMVSAAVAVVVFWAGGTV
jgi:diacylglycerol kinase (ATP)